MADITQLPEHIGAEVEQLQSRVWHLRNLIAAVTEATAEGAQGTLDDPLAAMIGLVEFADAIHNDLDKDDVTRRVADRLQEAQEAPLRGQLQVGRFTDDDANRTPFPGLPAALSCPFCGDHEDIMISEVAGSTKDDPHFRAHCGTCGVDAPGGESLAEAAAEWNQRGSLRQQEVANG